MAYTTMEGGVIMPTLDNDFLKYLQGASAGFQPYAAGVKRYGPTGVTAPNIGPVADRTGYVERDLKAKAMRNGMLKRMKARNQGRLMSSDNLDPNNRSF